MSYKLSKINIAAVIVSSLLLIIAFLHKRQLNFADTSAYTTSFYIPLEMLFFVITSILILINTFSAIISLVKKRWAKLLYTLFALLISIILLTVALIVDAPTLMYMT